MPIGTCAGCGKTDVLRAGGYCVACAASRPRAAGPVRPVEPEPAPEPPPSLDVAPPYVESRASIGVYGLGWIVSGAGLIALGALAIVGCSGYHVISIGPFILGPLLIFVGLGELWRAATGRR